MCLHAPIPPPPSPLPPTLGEPAVRFGTPKCEELHQGTTNSFILPQMSTLAKLAVMLKRFVPKFTKQYVMWTDRQWSSPHMFKTANSTGRAPSLDVAPLAAKMLTHASWPPWSSNCSIHFNTNNQCYFIFNRLDSPNKGKYF